MAKILKLLTLAALAAVSIVVTACGSRTKSEDTVDVIDEKYVHRYGMAVPSDFWASSGEHGLVVSTLADGVVVTKSYASGVLEGDTTYSYPHSSQIQKRQTYQSGALTQETEYFFDGTPRWQNAYNCPEYGSTTMCTWYLSGTPKSVELYQGNNLVTGDYFTTLNQRDAFVEGMQGSRLNRDDYGQLQSTDKIENGQMVLRQTFHPNGSPKETIPYCNGLIDGTKRTYHPAGEPDTIEQWSVGQQEGATVVFQHGERYAEIPYYNGEKHGVECRYRDGSDKVQEISWHSGQLTGPSTTYVGDNVKTDWYYKGKPVSKTDYEFITNRPMVR